MATSTFEAGVADLHRTVFTDSDDTLVIWLADLILVAKAQLSALDPEAGALIPDDLTDAIIDVQTSPVVIDAVQSVDDARAWSVLLPLLGMAALAMAAWLAPSGVAGTARVGVSIAAAGGLVLLLQSVARAFVVTGDRADERVAEVVWEAYTDDLTIWGLTVIGIGAVVWAVAWFGVGDVSPGQRLQQPRNYSTGRRPGATVSSGVRPSSWSAASWSSSGSSPSDSP